MAAVTLTGGTNYGAGVTIAGLGMTMGNGMSRFETRPGHPNSVAPGKRPLHNMAPTIVRRGGWPVLAVGGRGSRRIPNAVLTALVHFMAMGEGVEAAVAAPRAHTEGTPEVDFESSWPAEELKALPALGYHVSEEPSAVVSAVSFDPRSGEIRGAMR
jgi:gamma-glutamyltranspeptidase/glutathione hydrolase